MREITVKKVDLLTALRKNRADHRTIFEEALEGYRREAERRLNEHLEALRQGIRRSIHVQLMVPRDHTKDYDRAIMMMEMAVGDEITVTDGDFKCYVMDDWGWMDQFVRMSNSYGSTTSLGKYGTVDEEDS